MSGRLAILFVLCSIACRGAAAPPLFDVDRIEGKPLRGVIASLGDNGQLRLDGQEKSLSSSEWIGLRRAGSLLPPAPTALHLVLTTGDLIPVRNLHLMGNGLS